MDCPAFLERYSEFRDGLLPDVARRGMMAHLAVCHRCRRYDVLLSRGVLVLKSTSDCEPSAEFRRRLRQRLAEEARRPQARQRAGWVVGGLVAAAALVLAVVPPDRSGDAAGPAPASPQAATPTRPGPSTAHAVSDELPAVRLERRAPDLDLTVPAFGRKWHTPRAREDHLFRTVSATR